MVERRTEPVNNFETNNRGSRGTPSSARRILPRADSRPDPAGRYDGRRERTWSPPDGLASMPASEQADTVTAAVPDPYAVGDERILATVNRRVDVLEHERSRHLISEDAYRAGRLVQLVLERCSGTIGGSNWCGASRGDPVMAHEINVIRAISNAELVRRYLLPIRGRLGMIDTMLLRRILAERISFADCAALQGKAGERGERYVAARYREALEDLAVFWAARGKAQPTPDDKHAAAAPAAAARQDAAVVGGATLKRLENELEALTAAGGRKVDIEAITAQIADLRLRQGMARVRTTT